MECRNKRVVLWDVAKQKQHGRDDDCERSALRDAEARPENVRSRRRASSRRRGDARAEETTTLLVRPACVVPIAPAHPQRVLSGGAPRVNGREVAEARAEPDMEQGPQAALRALLFGLCFLWGVGGAGGGCAARASIRDCAREVERLWILWTVWTNRPPAGPERRKKSRKKSRRARLRLPRPSALQEETGCGSPSSVNK